MENNYLQNLQSDERMMAMFSHLSIFMGGIFLPLIFWAVSKDKSKYITFHSLQALFFHIAFIAAIILWVGAIMIFGFGFGLLGAASNSKEITGLMILFFIVLYGSIFVLIAGLYGASIYMSIVTYKGSFAKYPIIGHIIYKKIYGNS